MSAHNLNEVALQCVIDDVSTAGQAYIAVPSGFDGDIKRITATLDAGVTTADATLTVKNSDGTTLGTLTVVAAGSAAGTTFSGSLSGLSRPGYAIEVETDGGSTGAAKCYVTVVIKR